MDTGPAQPPGSSRARLMLAGGLATLLVILVVGITVLSGGDGPAPEPADPACVQAWNADQVAVARGTHQASGHSYSRAQVLRVSGDGGPLAEGEKGTCAVAFASNSLDTELGAAAQMLTAGRWRPISDLPGIDAVRLSELQSDAVQRANAQLLPSGTLEAD